MNEALAFFDVDHTLTRAATGRRFVMRLVREGLISPSILFRMPFIYIAYRGGRMSGDRLALGLAALRGMSAARLAELAEDCYRQDISRDIYAVGLEHIASLAALGVRIVLASSTLDVVLRPLAERIGAEAVIASSLETEDGFLTGRLSSMAFGKGKLELARTYALASGIALSNCSFYTDSCHDLPLLLEVGRPVAVNPDRLLARVAREREWEHMDFRGRST